MKFQNISISDTGAEILRVLWELDEPSGCVHVYERVCYYRKECKTMRPSPSTIAVTLSRMLSSGLLKCNHDGYRSLYYPMYSKEVVIGGVIDNILTRFTGTTQGQSVIV